MVPRDHKYKRMPLRAGYLRRERRPHACVFETHVVAPDASLEAGVKFSEVVPEAGKTPPGAEFKSGGKVLGETRRFLQMLG